MTERTGNKVPNNVTHKKEFPEEQFTGFYLPFEQFLAAVPDLYLILSPDLIVQSATTAFLKATHHQLQDLVGKYFLEVLTPGLSLSNSTAAQRIQAAVQETISTQKPQRVVGLEGHVTFMPSRKKPGAFKKWNILSTPVATKPSSLEAILLKFEEVNLPATPEEGKVELETPPVAPQNGISIGYAAEVPEEDFLLQEAQEHAIARENLFKTAEEVGQFGSYEIDLETGSLTFSDGMFRLFGEEPQSFTPTLDFINSRVNPEDIIMVRKILDQAASDKKPYFYTRRIQRKNGEWRQTESHEKVICDAAGRVVRLIGLVQDVTDRNTTEKEFRESKKLLQSVFDTNLMAFSILEAVRGHDGAIQDFRIKMVNKALEKQTQCTDLVGRLYTVEYPGIKTAGLFDCMLRVMDTGETSQFEYHYPHEGFNHWFSCTFVKIDNGIFASNLDITTRKQAELKLAEQTYLIQRITETVPDMISVMELKSRKTIYQNKEIFTLYGYEPEVLESLNGNEKSRLIHPEDQPVLAEYFEKFNTIGNEEINTVDYRAINFLKNWQWFHARGKVFQRDENGKITQILNVIQNITKRKNAEQELKESKEMLQEAYNAARQSKDQFEAAINVSPVVLSILKTVRNEQHEIIDFYFEWVSKSGENLIGRDVTGQKLKENFPQLWQIQVFQQFAQTAETGKPTDYESHYQSDELELWVRWKAVQLTDGLFVSVEDITERKKGETELVKNLTLLRQSEELVGLGSWEYNPETQEFKWSDGMYQLFGLKPGSPWPWKLTWIT
ncbi:PAS domain-containing protein [Adhaeribacter pallidiroseus]|uniref:histidine kinase n=1 Tax=Adhaeribacter pallidiroseus TaxID=2072847 RepID=A0A369QG78_9BACT|nr:PAS domain-containing protein [Adhaeribacter pallidiroseus]RDC62545.1 Protein-glutamate O-methyltransferase [Adhaeribacter pallidiroseus]